MDVTKTQLANQLVNERLSSTPPPQSSRSWPIKGPAERNKTDIQLLRLRYDSLLHFTDPSGILLLIRQIGQEVKPRNTITIIKSFHNFYLESHIRVPI